MRYALSGSLAALSFSLTNALAIDRDGSCAVVYQTKYVHAAEPSVVPGAGGYGQGSGDAEGDVPAEEADVDTPEEASHGYGHGNGYATPDASSSAVKPQGSSYSHGYATPEASSSAVKPSASGYHHGSGSSSKASVSSASASAATGYGSGYSVGSSAPAVSSKGASSTGYWSSYGVPSANASSSTAGGAGYATGVSVSSSAGVSTPIIVDPSFPASTIADPSFTTSAKASSFSTSIIVTPSGLTSAPAQPTATGTPVYGPNVIPNGNFDSDASGWLGGERKDVGAQAKSGSYVYSAVANKESFNSVHFSYVVGPLNWDGKYRFSFYLKAMTALPADTSCDFGVNIEGAELADVYFTASDAANEWKYVEVNDIVVKSALNTLRFNAYCLSDTWIENGGEVEFQMDTVELVEQTPPVSTVSPTSAPAQATPSGTVYGPNSIPNGNFDSDASGWIGQRKDVGAQAQSGSYVLSLPVNAKTYQSATFDYMVGPLNWDGKYHASFYWKVASTVPADVVCEVSAGMGVASFYRGAASIASNEWQHIAVDNIAINSAINDFTVDFDCGPNAFFDNGGEIEFQLDTVDLFEQISPVTTTTPSQVCSTAAPTGTPGPNIVRGGEIASPANGWDYSRVTTVKDVGAEAHSAPYVLAITPTEVLPFGDLSAEIQPGSLDAKYTISFWVRFVSSNMPKGTEPTLVTEVGFQQVDRHIFSASDLEKGWMHMEFKDVKLEKLSEKLKFDFFDYGFPGQLVPGGELTWWLDDVQMWEQAPEIVTCV